MKQTRHVALCNVVKLQTSSSHQLIESSLSVDLPVMMSLHGLRKHAAAAILSGKYVDGT